MLRKKQDSRHVLRVETLEDRLVLTGFVAYNAFYSGPSADEFTTNFADAPGRDSAGPLINIDTGESTGVLLSASNLGAVIGGNGTVPAPGTDAALMFSDVVDFGSSQRQTIEVLPGNAYSYQFENLDIGAKYSFHGTAIRGNPSYNNRWTLVEIVGANSYQLAHSENESIYRTGLVGNQVALWSGDNSQSTQGGVVGWTDIDPGPDGSFEIISSHYISAVPTDIVPRGVANGSKGYALSAIRLEAQEPDGPPVLANSPATEVMATSATLAGSLLATGGQIPDITLFYGTTDGGTNAEDWQNSIEVLPAVNFSQVVYDLTEDTTYFFRSFGTHSQGSGWSEPTTFTTLTSGPPAISTSPPTEVGALSAQMVGMVDDTGNDSPVVTLYYGTTDGGTDAEAWDNAVDLGVQAGAIVQNVAGLQQGADYFYSLRAQNNRGIAWAAESQSFTTREIPSLLINEFLADNATSLKTRVRGDVAEGFVGDQLTPDWIELSTTEAALDVSGYSLTDDLNSPGKWRFPAGTIIPPTGKLVVFASGFNILDSQLDELGYLHTSFRLNSGAGAELALIDPDGDVVFAFENVPAQIEDVSYGIGAQTEQRFFAALTPGLPNAVELPAAPTVSVPSRTFTDSLSVELTPAIDTHTVHYTTNESRPTSSSPVYSGPIDITRSTMLRAISVGPNGEESIIVSESYVKFNASVSDDQSHLPILVVETFGSGIPRSVFGASFVGIIEPGEDGQSQLSDEFSLTTRAGIRVRGSSSAGFSKKQYRVEFRDELDEDRKQEVLGMPAEADWIFYGPSQFDRVLISNPLMYDLSNQIDRYATRTRWVEAYFDGRYFGVYAIMETIEVDNDRVDVEDLTTGAGGQPVEGGFIWKNDRGSAYVDPGDTTAAQRRYIDGTIEQLQDAAASSNFRDPDVGYEAYADVDSFIDHNILNLLAMNVDALRLSSFYYKTADGKLQAGPIWDFDRSLDSTDGRDNNPRSWFGTGDSTRYFNDSNRVMSWWSDMFQDPDFVQRYIDRWTELRENEFSLANINATIEKHAAELGAAAERDYDRWSGSRYGSFAGEINHLKEWISDRVEWIDSRWLPKPTSNVQGDRVSVGTSVTLSSSNGPIYYMLDGTDPRGENGVRRAEAQILNGPIVISEDTQLVARIFNTRFGGSNGYVRSGDDWSAPVSISAASEPASVGNLAISQIHFNPAPADVLAGEENEDNDEFEFVAIMNVGQSPVELEGVRFVQATVGPDDTEGVTFEFEAQVLQPRESIVVVENVGAFQSRYGSDVRISLGRDGADGTPGQYGGKLSNGGERLTLVAADDVIIRQLDYEDDWYPATDGDGYALVNDQPWLQLRSQLSDASAWRQSTDVGGSPGESAILGDIDLNNTVDATDIDLLYAAINQNAQANWFDLSADGETNAADIEFLLNDVLNVRRGDTNLDGLVDFQDFLIFSSRFGQADAGWADGDYDGDGDVGFPDFLALSANFGSDRPSRSASRIDLASLAAQEWDDSEKDEFGKEDE